MSFRELVDALLDVRVIYVGESHGHPPDHDLQGRIAAALYERSPSLGVGLEMIQTPFQPVADAWVRGELSEEEFLQQTEWEERWGGDFASYRRPVVLCRDQGLPLVALNAPKEITRTVGREGLDGLSDEQRTALPELDLEVAPHRAMIMEALGGHPGMDGEVENPRLERFYVAQVIWDETMAESVARVMNREDAPERMVVLAGGMHVRRGLGIPMRAARRGAEPFVTILPVDPRELEEQDEPLADYLWVRPNPER
ncbi:MAG: ChaN family lipoprotein [Myxococcota bacterium]